VFLEARAIEPPKRRKTAGAAKNQSGTKQDKTAEQIE
jgi:hypothetical protein